MIVVSDRQSHQTATQRGDRIEKESVATAGPILRRQFELALGLAGRLARDRAAGVSAQASWNEAVKAGLARGIADYVRDGLRSG